MNAIIEKWIGWVLLAILVVVALSGMAFALTHYQEALLDSLGLKAAHAGSVIYAAIFGMAALLILFVAAIVIGVHDNTASASNPTKAGRVFRNIIVVLLGSICGWGIALVFSPFGDQDAERLHSIFQALTVFASGYLVSKLDRYLEKSLFGDDGKPTTAWINLGFFSTAFLTTLLMTYSTRTYSYDPTIQIPTIEFPAAPGITVTASKNIIKINAEKVISVNDKAYGIVSTGAVVKIVDSVRHLYIDDALRNVDGPYPDPKPEKSSTPPAPAPAKPAPATTEAATGQSTGK